MSLLDVIRRDHRNDDLLSAAEEGRASDIRAFLDTGVDVRSQERVLIRAAANGHRDVVRVLVDASVDVNARDEHGKTALIWAASMGHLDVVRILLEAGAEVNARDVQGCTAFNLALGKGYLNIMHFLWEAELGLIHGGKGDRRSADHNKKLVQSAIERSSEGEPDSLSDLVAESCVGHGGWQNRGRLKKLLQDVGANYRSIDISAEDVIAEADKVAVRVRWTGTTGDGRRETFQSISIYRVADGKIVEHWGQDDALF